MMAKKRIHSKLSLANVDMGKVFEDKDKKAASTTTFVEEEIFPLTVGITT